MKKLFLGLMVIVVVAGGGLWWSRRSSTLPIPDEMTNLSPEPLDVTGQPLTSLDQLGQALQIETMRQREYPGSEITVVETLAPGSNYQRYRVSYESDGNTIYALMTIPNGEKPVGGWPLIVFNHGYIPPAQYRTTERYVAYVDTLARAGYIVFRSDYRGHDQSEGEPSGAYGSPGYTIDVLNAVASLKKHPDVNPDKIGMWGHSMGGYITLRNMVITNDVKVGVIWAGVVGSYADMMANWRRGNTGGYSPPPVASGTRRWRDVLQETYGAPEANPTFWNSISANSYLTDLSGPIQIHHAKGDSSVPWEFSQTLDEQIKAAGKTDELYIYEGDDHNITANFGIAMRRTVAFFDQYLK